MKLVQVGAYASMLVMLVNGLSFADVKENDIELEDAVDEERIFGGSDARPGNFPYLASLRDGSSGSTFCGGSLIAPQYVLTAGHCFECDLNDMYVSFGMRHTSGEGSTKAEKIRVSKLFRHPQFNFTDLTYDVALLKLETPSTRKLASLAAADGSNNKPGTVATVMGWGLVNNETEASTLKAVDVQIISDEECSQYTYTKTVLCAGTGDGKDSCMGDSGGPLIANGVVVGIVSGGFTEECGTLPSSYTRITGVLGYIHDILNGGSTGDVTGFLTMPYNFSMDPPRPLP